ncbi:MAG: polysaccharide biosynthesis tyrosine autokinase [Isosphaeraceae bacterium]
MNTKLTVNTNWVRVTLDGGDPARTAKQLYTLLDIFEKDSRAESDNKNDDTRRYARQSLEVLQTQLKDVERRVVETLAKANFIGPNGTNLIQSQYESVGMMLAHKRSRLDEFRQQAWVGQLFPKFNPGADDPEMKGEIAQLLAMKRKLTKDLQEEKRRIRNFNSDPSVRHTASQLEHVMNQLNELRNLPREAALDPSDMLVASMRDEIAAAEKDAKTLLAQLKESMPEHQKFLALQDEREATLKRIYDLQTKISEFDMLAQSQKPPVVIPTSVAEPSVPVRPRRSMNIALALIFSFGLGIALVCLLEYLDHTVRVPEQLTTGLTLPLLGVVPRIRRTSLVHRNGHLWTPGDPGSVEADAYRSLRASLLGVGDRLGPIATLLVTSAKAGEGKSTTSLNLAATCARAGERTLLMDVDLRRPSLADAFEKCDPDGPGLVDILRGKLPWQRTVVRSDIRNLDFLPAGDARDTPIEILGTLELRQLLIALTGHYDRVILDGPAVLGLADCRMLGRVVDAAILVVRSGAHEMRPLQRAKAMLEQSHVVLAGAVFNGLRDDLQNWSSYGPYTPYGGDTFAAGDGPAGLGGADDVAALPLAGSAAG